MRKSIAAVCAGVLAAVSMGVNASSGQVGDHDPASGDSVTVVGKRPTKPCNPHDSGCILAVAKEVWTRYPEQIQTFCSRSIIDKAHQQLLIEQMADLGLFSSISAPAARTTVYEIPPALKTVCDYKPETPVAYDRSVATWAPWAAAPSAADLAAAYPKAGRALADGGDAKLYCTIAPDGRLSQCSVSQEFPDHKGFGAAALKLAGKFRVLEDPAHPRPAAAAWVDLAIHFPNPATPAAPPQILHPDWIALPAADQTARLYPAAAAQAGVRTGVGRVDCQVGEAGALGPCTVAGEDPPGLGFGAAALAAAPGMRANLWSRDGLRTPGAHVVVPLRFNAEDARSGS